MTAHTVICLASSLSMVLLSKSLCDASSLTVPRSLVAVLGDRVELKCSADGDQHVIWGFTSFNTSKDTDIYFGDDIISPSKSRYKIDKRISGQHNLVIESVDLDHAGRYQCVIIATGNKTVSHLNVLGSSPACSANTSRADKEIVEHGYLWIWCRIVNTGNMIPIFSWTKTNTEEAIASNTSTSDDRTVVIITTSSVIRQLHTDDNGVTFKCNIRFQLPNNSGEKAPDYEYSWNYTANVLWSPSDPGTSRRTVLAAAVGVGSLLLLLTMITVSCFVTRKKLKGDIAFNRQPPSEHEQNGSNAFSVLENHGRDSESIPVYAEVKKGNGQKERERTKTNHSAPVHADVKMKKKANESLNSNSTAAFDLSDDSSPSPQVSIQKKKRQNRVGADGTEYLDISEVRQPFNMSTARAATQPASDRTNYAFIDHTARVPPPPPKF